LVQADRLGPKVGGHLALRATFIRWTGWTLTVAVHCYDDRTINIVVAITITITDKLQHTSAATWRAQQTQYNKPDQDSETTDLILEPDQYPDLPNQSLGYSPLHHKVSSKCVHNLPRYIENCSWPLFLRVEILHNDPECTKDSRPPQKLIGNPAV